MENKKDIHDVDGKAVNSEIKVMIPDVSALVVGALEAVLVSPQSLYTQPEYLSFEQISKRIKSEIFMVCHGRAISRRLKIREFQAFDVLELFSFVFPARPCQPTPRGLAAALNLPEPKSLAQEAQILPLAVSALLNALYDSTCEEKSDPHGIAQFLVRYRWPWALFVIEALRSGAEKRGGAQFPTYQFDAQALEVWKKLQEYSEYAPDPSLTEIPVEPIETRRRLAEMLAACVQGKVVEPRPQQADYASAVSQGFQQRTASGDPQFVLAEAGTGVGKTLGYLASASLWAEKNRRPVWISTFTRNLQNQIDGELDRLYTDPETKARRVVLRKGRENYLCLLNFQDAVYQIGLLGQDAVMIALMARWVAATRDGDLVGGDFPGWLVDLLGGPRVLSVADRRGECIFSGCPYYNRCFIERSVRRARRADIVIANHALVMIQASNGGDDLWTPARYVFDEGHHVFDAADSTFSEHLSGQETAELRRWLLGNEGEKKGRARGLHSRMSELIGSDRELSALLEEIVESVRLLPSNSWMLRLTGENPQGCAEEFFSLVRSHVLNSSDKGDAYYSVESETGKFGRTFLSVVSSFDQGLERIFNPMKKMVSILCQKLEDEESGFNQEQKRQIDFLIRSMERRGLQTLTAWRAMLQSLKQDAPLASDVVDWFRIERSNGREVDVGMFRHYVDPTAPFVEAVVRSAQGVVITSATLTDGGADDWSVAEQRSGAIHLKQSAFRARVPSPFDYASRTRVLIVSDINKSNIVDVSEAYRKLFLAAGGGGLGLFTAINRLKSVHERIVGPLDESGLPLYAQHVDGLDVATLIDIFRAEEHACLLGTDAVRDGVDVPGRSLRLIVFDRVPWPRPNLLHRARRKRFGGRRYDEMITRLRLKQAFGRLIRRADDVGVFVLLDPSFSDHLNLAFPEGVTPRYVGLSEAVRITQDFLKKAEV
ncbi:ATP-dependent DNA helicase DinG [Azospirillaceae bacterium]